MLSNHQNYSPPRSDDNFLFFFYIVGNDLQWHSIKYIIDTSAGAERQAYTQ